MVRSSLFSIAALLQLVIVLVSGAEFEGSTYWPIYTFNNGTVESDKSCPADEWARLQTAMSAALERDTVMINNTSTEVTNGIGNRLLRQQGQQRQNRHLSCNSCGGKALCLAKAVFMRNGRQVGCATTYGHGRMLTEDGGSSTSSNTNPCSDDIAAVDAAFDELTGEISASCLSLLNAPRRIECAKYTRDCDIVGFTVWSYTNGARNNKVLVTHLNATGTSFCKSAGYINIEARADFILGDVTLELSGPQTRTHLETSPPYLAFGKMPLLNMGRNRYFAMLFGMEGHYMRYFVYGSTMAVGEYTIKAYSQGDPASGKTATFTVNNC